MTLNHIGTSQSGHRGYALMRIATHLPIATNARHGSTEPYVPSSQGRNVLAERSRGLHSLNHQHGVGGHGTTPEAGRWRYVNLIWLIVGTLWSYRHQGLVRCFPGPRPAWVAAGGNRKKEKAHCRVLTSFAPPTTFLPDYDRKSSLGKPYNWFVSVACERFAI